MLNLLVSALLVITAIYTAYLIIRRTISTVVILFPIPHKLVLPSEIFYCLAILGLCCGLAFLIVRPGGLVNHSLARIEERLTNTNWQVVLEYPSSYISDQYSKRQQQLHDLEMGTRVTRFSRNIATGLGSLWSNIVQFGAAVFQGISQFVMAILQPIIQEGSSVQITPRSNFKEMFPANFMCVANPGAEYNSVFLRENPSWTGPTDRRFIAARGTEIRFSGKVENDEGIWFVIDSEDGGRRYISEDICSTTLDLDSIPTLILGD